MAFEESVCEKCGLGERYNRNFLGGQSVVNFYGDRHKQRRKLLMPPFHGERM